ncbi:hypothetical protein NDA16_003203 [Ustilago loliicola]|nr:hypothetical protein NDA16_003203 [Ustilago loliicola]
MPKTISCPHAGCDYLFSKPVHLRRHLLSHSDEAVWKCPDCDQEFKRIDSFQRHKKRIHPDQPNLVAVKIGGDHAADTSIKSEDDDDADDRMDELDVSSNMNPPQHTSSSGLGPSGAGYSQATADQAAPLSIASLTEASPSWGSSSNSDTENQNFFDDILQSILMDSISSFVPHETMAPPADFQQGMAGSNLANDVFAFAEQNSQPASSAQPVQAQQHNEQAPSVQQQQQQQPQNQQSSSQSTSAVANQQQPPSQAQEAQPAAASSSSHPVPQPLSNLMPFATFTDSAYNSGRSTPGTPRHPPANGNLDDADEMTRLVEKVGDQAATSVGARTRDLILHGVNIPKKPPRLTAASLFSAATRHTRSMLPILPSYWLLDHRRLAAERPYVFISLLAIGTLWQPRADVKAYGAELWQLIFRSIWAGAVFYLDQPQLMREATAVMAFTHLYAFLCRDESIRRKSIHSTYTGSSLARELGWRQGIWFLVGPWEESLQRLLGPNLQMALVELEVLTRDQNTNKLSADQKSMLDRLHGVWKQWSDAEEVNRNMICHIITESHHSEFLSSYSQMRGMGRIACQALVPCADDVWDAKTAIEWAKLVLEHKATRESHDRPLCSGKRQLGPILDALFGIDAPSPATATSDQSEDGGRRDREKAKHDLERGLCFTVKEHFVLQSLLEGLHLLWIARHTPPYRTGTSYAADFSPASPSFGAGLESAFSLKGGTAYHKLNVLDDQTMLAALTRWMRLYHQSYMPNAVANSTGFNRTEANGKLAAGSGSTSSGGARAPSLGPSNDRFQLHFRFHVIQLSALFNAHHVVHALVATCGEPSDTTGSTVPNGAKGATTGNTARSGVQTRVPLRCESCVNPESCPYRNTRLQRWAAVHAGAVIGNFMSMPRLSTLTPTILEGLGQAFGILVILCRLQRSPAQRRRSRVSTTATVRAISRGVAKKVRSIETAEGAGAVVRRSIGTPALRNISPFLMLDHFRITEGAGFPDHPHRGQTTVTYILDGQSQHEDVAGHAGTIGPGDVQWMNAGHGIMHAEMPIHRDEKGNKLPDPVGLQLWVDLPKEAKKEPPSYQEHRAAQIPTTEPKEGVAEEGESGWKIKVVAGESHGVRSPIELPRNGGVLFLDIFLEPNGVVYQTIDPRYNAFIYTLEGETVVGDHPSTPAPPADEKLAFKPSTTATPGEAVQPYHTLVLTKADGEQGVKITNPSSTNKARMVLVAGEPLDQEVVQYGPFVMTNRQEIQQTLLDFQTGQNGFERAPGWRSKIGAHMT